MLKTFLLLLLLQYTFNTAYCRGRCSDARGTQKINCEHLSPKECEDNKYEFFYTCRKSCGWCNENTRPDPPSPAPVMQPFSVPVQTTTTTTTTTKEPEATWSQFTQYSKCSTTCGKGWKTRRRTCSVPGKCVGSDKQSKRCNLGSCLPANHGVWSGWNVSECEPKCGEGNRRWTRKCLVPGTCEGSPEQLRRCFTECSLARTLLEGWSECSQTCDHGHSFRYENCTEEDKTKCPKRWKDCQIKECPTDNCVDSEAKYLSESKCCALNNSTCGIKGTARIVGGAIASRWPWMGHMVKDATGEICGLSLIHPSWVLTAGHCVYNTEAAGITIILGADKLKDTGKTVQGRKGMEIIIHEEYNDNTLLADIALIKLSKPVKLDSRVNTICLPNGEALPEDEMCIVAGWGITDYRILVASPQLNELNVFKYPYDLCTQAFKRHAFGKSLDGRQICAGRVTGGGDSCQGDSGGPLMCQRCSSCNWYVAGVTSFGAERCGIAEKAAVYTKITSYEDWIKKHVSDVESGEYKCLKS